MANRSTGDTDWFSLARCKGMDPHLFHAPDLGDEHTGVAWDPAPGIFVCLRCCVRMECELYAREIGATQGVWGSIDFSKERRRWRDGRGEARERVDALAAKGYDALAIAELMGMDARAVGRMLARRARKVEA